MGFVFLVCACARVRLPRVFCCFVWVWGKAGGEPVWLVLSSLFCGVDGGVLNLLSLFWEGGAQSVEFLAWCLPVFACVCFLRGVFLGRVCLCLFFAWCVSRPCSFVFVFCVVCFSAVFACVCFLRGVCPCSFVFVCVGGGVDGGVLSLLSSFWEGGVLSSELCLRVVSPRFACGFCLSGRVRLVLVFVCLVYKCRWCVGVSSALCCCSVGHLFLSLSVVVWCKRFVGLLVVCWRGVAAVGGVVVGVGVVSEVAGLFWVGV